MHIFRLVFIFLVAVGEVSAAPVDLGSSRIEMPVPQGYVEVTPQMAGLWQFMQAAQGDNHILAFFIGEREKANALEGKPLNLERNINIQTRRKFEGATVTRDLFEQVKSQLKAMAASKQMDAIQARELERLNGNLEKAANFNPKFAQLENVTLPPHVDLPDQYGYSEISVEQATLPDGTVKRGRVTSTVMTVLVKGKLLSCYVTGGPDDLEWTRSAAKEWSDALLSANRN